MDVDTAAGEEGVALGLVPENERDNLQQKQIVEQEHRNCGHPRIRTEGRSAASGIVHASESDNEELVSEFTALGAVSAGCLITTPAASGLESAGSHASFSSDTSFFL